ncbi:hypothetical protein RND71_038144 [Anisodus tanguticus]|uniref:Uncharacterized protein n=1 Tax=Anisodus tanguticus TaxID=243964 RepID=A0AAE1QZE5_9SOLA|nr:hypothetical protein RND71_038144 [Anisodus tanguticus]
MESGNARDSPSSGEDKDESVALPVDELIEKSAGVFPGKSSDGTLSLRQDCPVCIISTSWTTVSQDKTANEQMSKGNSSDPCESVACKMIGTCSTKREMGPTSAEKLLDYMVMYDELTKGQCSQVTQERELFKLIDLSILT